MREGLVDGFVEDEIMVGTGGFRVSALVAAAAVLLLGAGEAFAGAQPDVGADTIGCFDQVLGGSPGAVWYLSDSTDPGSPNNFTQWTEFGDRVSTTIPVVGRWGGANVHGIGVYEEISGATTGLWTGAADPTSSTATNWYALPIENSIVTGTRPVGLAGNWAGPGNPGVGLYYPDTGHFVIDTHPGNPTAIEPFLFGPVSAGNVLPVVGDFNGDGNDSVGVYDNTNGIFYLLKQLPINGTDELAPLEGSLDNLLDFYFGDPATDMVPVAGDWDLQGGDSIGLYDATAGVFRLRNSNDGGTSDSVVAYDAGGTCQPVAGNWNLGAQN